MTAALPPHDSDAEEAALGSAMIADHAARVVADDLDESDYWHTLHRLAHRAIVNLNRSRDGIDTISVAAWIDEHVTDPGERVAWEKDGRARIIGLASGTFYAAHVDRYVAIVKRHGLARRTLQALDAAARSVHNGDDLADVLATHAQSVAQLAAGGTGRHLHRLADVAAEWIEETRLDATDGGLRFGWPTIDGALTTPVRRGEVVVVAARSGVGKTFALLDISANMLSTRPGSAIFASLEMPRTDIFERVAGQALDIGTPALRTAALTDDDAWTHVHTARDYLDRLLLHDAPTGVNDLPRLVADARRDGHDPALICVDYLGLLRWHGHKSASVYERISEIARSLKGIAIQERVVILAAAQLNRDGGGGERPTMEMIRDSGAIEEAADRILALWAPSRDPKITDAERVRLRDVVRACLLKNRKGLLGDVAELDYSPGRRLRETYTSAA